MQKIYKLDWETADICLAKNRFVHTLRRPDAELILEREDELQVDIPISKDGSYTLPDPTVNEEIDARYFDRIVVESKGYAGDIPELHKAAAFQGLYKREYYVDENADIFADEIPVIEEIGGGAVPDFTVRHVMRQPTEAEIKVYRRKASSSTAVKPGKRGRQVITTKSSLRTGMQHYALWLARVEGATVGGETFTAENREAFIATIDPLVQRKVVAEFADAVSNELLD